MSIDVKKLREDMAAAERLEHPQRAMRVTLECGHIRLLRWVDTVMGLGALTGCMVCPPEPNGYSPARMVVNVEETGVLHEESMYRLRDRAA